MMTATTMFQSIFWKKIKFKLHVRNDPRDPEIVVKKGWIWFDLLIFSVDFDKRERRSWLLDVSEIVVCQHL